MSKASDAGKAFWAGVLAKLPEAQRGQAEQIFAAAEAESALEVLGTGALAQPEINRRFDEARAQTEAAQTKLDELNAWYAANHAALQEFKTIKPEYETLKAGKPTTPITTTDPVDARAIAQEEINRAGQQYVSVSAWIAAKAVEHLHRFNEPLDTMALVANPKLGKPLPGQPDRVFSLNDAYQEAYGERVKVKLDEAHKADIEKQVQERLTEERKKYTSHPFPLPSESTLPIDTINDPSRPKHDLDSAVAEYDRLQMTRGA